MSVADPDGSDLPSLGLAKREALVALRQAVADRLRYGAPLDVPQIEIANETGQILATVLVEEALRSLRQ